MADTEIKIGLSPEEVVAALKQMGEQAKDLQAVFEQSLGKKSSSAINDLKDTAERGTNQITKFFSNMGQRIRQDLKTAFDISSVMAGANFAKQIGEGVRQVYDMEKAFDRLNIRMGLSNKQMTEFKISAGRAAAAAGVNLQDIAPGLMSAASRGNVKDPAQMTMIASSLAQAKQINPEMDSGIMTDNIAEILKRQHIAMTGQSFTQAMDAINSATAAGGFHSNSDAASHIAGIAPYAQQLGLDTRTMAGLAAVSSKAGDSGENTLMQLLQQGSGVDKGARLNQLFGSEVFKNGKLDAHALANVNTSQFGDVSQQVLEQTTGITGASGGDLKMFIDTWRDNMKSFDDVVKGSGETAEQFGKMSQTWAGQVGIFKSNLVNTGREIGDSIAEMVHGLMTGDASHSGGTHLAKALYDNAGTIATGGALSIGAGLLMGGGIRGLIGGAAASAADVQKVYVTNAAEMGGGESGIVGKIGSKIGGWGKNLAANAAVLGGASMGEIGAMGAGAMGLAAVGVGVAGYGGYKIGQGINNLTGNEGGAGDWLYKKMHPDEYNSDGSMKKDIVDAIVEGMKQAKAGVPTLNPSSVKGRGASAFGQY